MRLSQGRKQSFKQHFTNEWAQKVESPTLDLQRAELGAGRQREDSLSQAQRRAGTSPRQVSLTLRFRRRVMAGLILRSRGQRAQPHWNGAIHGTGFTVLERVEGPQGGV